MKKLIGLIPAVSLVPFLAFAQGEMAETTTFLSNIVNFINTTLIPLIFAVAFLVFLWGMFVTFILGGKDSTKQEEGKSLMLYAVIGFVVMLSLWGIVNLLVDSFGFGDDTITPPAGISIGG